MRSKVIILTGPTASGKTGQAVQLARKFGGEIISADSRQIFKGMDLGSGKDLNEYQEIPYHLIDILPAGEEFSASLYQERCLTSLAEITARGNLPIICGGTGHYLKSLIQGYPFDKPGTDLITSLALEALPKSELFERLAKIPGQDQKDWNKESKRRLARLLEKNTQPDKNTSQPSFEELYEYRGFYLAPLREELKERIIRRLQERLDLGMIDEVADLLRQGISATRLKRYGLEYKWITLHLLGEMERDEMEDKLATEIKRFAKRQMTFIRYMIKEGVALEAVDSYEELEAAVGDYLLS